MIVPIPTLAASAAMLAGLTILTCAALRAWSGWLALRRLELTRDAAERPSPTPAARIELADLRERVRKLEAIAAGVDY